MFKMGCSMARKILTPGGSSSSSPPSNVDLANNTNQLSPSGSGGNQSRHRTAQQDQQGQSGPGATPRLKSGDELNDFSKLEEDPRLPLNVRQIFKITKSWKAIARTMSKTGTAMFLNLFEQNQDLFYLFVRFQHLKSKQELHESMELREHAATVMSTLDQSINLLSDYDNFISYLHSIGKLHRKVPGFKREHFWKIEQPFLKAIKQTLDERCNETIEEIYKIAIKLIIETISDGYGQDNPDNQLASGESGPPSPLPDASGKDSNSNGSNGGASGASPSGLGAGGGAGGDLKLSACKRTQVSGKTNALSQDQVVALKISCLGSRSASWPNELDHNGKPIRLATQMADKKLNGHGDNEWARREQIIAPGLPLSSSSSPSLFLHDKYHQAARGCAEPTNEKQDRRRRTRMRMRKSKLIDSANGMIQSMEQLIGHNRPNGNDGEEMTRANNFDLMQDSLRTALNDTAKEIRKLARARDSMFDDEIEHRIAQDSSSTTRLKMSANELSGGDDCCGGCKEMIDIQDGSSIDTQMKLQSDNKTGNHQGESDNICSTSPKTNHGQVAIENAELTSNIQKQQTPMNTNLKQQCRRRGGGRRDRQVTFNGKVDYLAGGLQQQQSLILPKTRLEANNWPARDSGRVLDEADETDNILDGLVNNEPAVFLGQHEQINKDQNQGEHALLSSSYYHYANNRLDQSQGSPNSKGGSIGCSAKALASILRPLNEQQSSDYVGANTNTNGNASNCIKSPKATTRLRIKLMDTLSAKRRLRLVSSLKGKLLPHSAVNKLQEVGEIASVDREISVNNDDNNHDDHYKQEKQQQQRANDKISRLSETYHRSKLAADKLLLFANGKDNMTAELSEFIKMLILINKLILSSLTSPPQETKPTPQPPATSTLIGTAIETN